MKREKLNVLSERDLIIGLIVSEKFCREICPILNPRLLEIEYTRIVAGWIKDFYSNFKKVPQKDILKIYRAHCDEIPDEDLQDNILSFIEKVCRDYDDIKNFNDEYMLQQAVLYLKGRSLKNLSEDIDSFLSTGNIEKAESRIIKYKSVEKNSGKAVSLLHNKEAIINSFTQDDDLLFRFPGAYGSVVGDVHREDFISYLAPMKRGKSFILIDAGVTAVQKGLKVVHVSLEMSESQMLKRYWTALSGQLNKSKDDISYSFFEKNDDGKFEIKYKTISRKAVSISEVENKQNSFKRLFRGGDIRVLVAPAYGWTVEKLESELDILVQQENYIPDVIIVDYADIMAPSEKSDYRNQLDGIWKRLRGLAQKRKAVVFTASQSGRASINKNVDSKDIAEDIRKLAHITSMVSLNQTPIEKKNGILRLKQLAVREGESEFREAICTQCLSIGRIVTDSHFDDEVLYEVNDLKRNKKNRL
ncbi:MAG: hypothetical protein GX220_05065 [Treponema sp.]|mgnify:CR=1 FL=1|nr:hypothetical protein [Treponema sp.]